MDFTDGDTFSLVVLARALVDRLNLGEPSEVECERADELLDEILLLIIGRSHNGDSVARAYVEGEHRKAGA